MERTGIRSYYLYDGLGSVTGVTNALGGVASSFAYDVFGEIRSGGGGVSEFRFTGEQRDPQQSRKLYYLRARHVGNNPVNFVDPTGLCPNGCESRFQVRTLPALPTARCPVEPMARARCAHAHLQVSNQRISMIREIMEWLFEGLEAIAEIVHRSHLCLEAGSMIGLGVPTVGAGVFLQQPIIVYVGATYVVTGFLINYYYCRPA